MNTVTRVKSWNHALIAAFALVAVSLHAENPYDANVEYLEAPVGTGGVPYIDTGFKPADDMGVRLRVVAFRDSANTTVCGAMATVKVDDKNVDWRWYMGFTKKTDGYLSWGMGNPGTRFSYSPNTIYDVLFNHFNSRNRRVEKVGGGYAFDLPITDALPFGANQNIYLFAYNNRGTAGNTGNARIYSAQFTKGNNVVMDLIPVRKDGVGYMYDKVSETLLAKVPTAPLAFIYVNDAANEVYIEENVMFAADSFFMTARNTFTYFNVPDGATAKIDLGGHTFTNSLVYGTQMYIPLPIENGTMVARNLTTEGDGGYVLLDSDTSGRTATFNLVMETVALQLYGTLSVSNYVAHYKGGYNHGNAAIKFYGTLRYVHARRRGRERARVLPWMRDAGRLDDRPLGEDERMEQRCTGLDRDGQHRWQPHDDVCGRRDGGNPVRRTQREVGGEDHRLARRCSVKSCVAHVLRPVRQWPRTKLKVMDDGLYAPHKGFILIVKSSAKQLFR